MPSPGPFGIQPALSELTRRRWTIAAAAREIGCSYSQLYNVTRGVTPPSSVLRDKLPRLLGVELEQLFTRGALAAAYLTWPSGHAGGRRLDPAGEVV